LRNDCRPCRPSSWCLWMAKTDPLVPSEDRNRMKNDSKMIRLSRLISKQASILWSRL
jgi:hypothetical protein